MYFFFSMVFRQLAASQKPAAFAWATMAPFVKLLFQRAK